MQGTTAGSASPVKRTSRIRLATYTVAFVTLLAFLIGHLSTGSLAYPDALIPSSGAYFGAFASREGEDSKDVVLRLESQVGRRLAIDHQYYAWNQTIPTSHQSWDATTGRLPFVNWSAATTDGSPVRWSAIANGSQDSWIVQRADAFKAFGSPIYLTFHHEPENDLTRFGTPTDYAAAFRHIVTVFRSRGVTNVAFVWTMMSWTFEPRSGRDPNVYYPGDSYVDIIGSDGYNWYPGKAGVPWASFQQIFQDTNNFAVAHNKPWMVVETGCQEDPAHPSRKGQWFRDIVVTAQGWPLLKAVMYFDATNDYDWNSDSSVSSMQGFAELGRDVYMDSGSNPPPAPTLRNNLDLGPDGASVVAGQATVGDPFSQVVTTSGSTLTYSSRHSFVTGEFSARHVLTSGGNAYYQWTGLRSIWYGRLYVWLGYLPASGLRLVRGSANDLLRCALDIMPDGTLRWVDQYNHPIIATTTPIALGTWVRIEWKVDHTAGQVTIELFNSSSSSTATQTVVSATGRAIGLSVEEVQYGRSGTQPFAFKFWTDGPALSSARYFGTT